MLRFELNKLSPELNRFPLEVRSRPPALKKFRWKLNRFKSKATPLTFVLNRLPSEMNRFSVEMNKFTLAVKSLPLVLKKFRWDLNCFKPHLNLLNLCRAGNIRPGTDSVRGALLAALTPALARKTHRRMGRQFIQRRPLARGLGKTVTI